MSGKQPRSFKTAGLTLLAFVLIYIVVDGAVFGVAEYLKGNEGKGTSWQGFLWSGFVYLPVKIVAGYYPILFVYLYVFRFSLDKLQGWQVLWMSCFNAMLTWLTLLILGIPWTSVKGDDASTFHQISLSGAITPIVLWLVLLYIQRLRRT